MGFPISEAHKGSHMTTEKTYRRMNKALRLAHSGEAENVLAAAHEILATRMKHGDALASLEVVRD